MSGVHLRAARSTDAGAIGAILSAFVAQTDWMPNLHSHAEDIGFAGKMIERWQVTVAEVNGRVVGFLAQEQTDINSLYVDSAHRGKGVGSALLHAAQAASTCLELWTFEANTRAQSFYARHGFAETQRTDGTGNDEGLPDIRLVWQKEAT